MYASLKVTQPGFSMAPMLNSGTNSWLYSSNGYVSPKYFSKKSRPAAVISNISSACASTHDARDSRHHSAIGMWRGLRSPVWNFRATWGLGDGGSGGFVLKGQVLRSPRGSVRRTRRFPQARHARG